MTSGELEEPTEELEELEKLGEELEEEPAAWRWSMSRTRPPISMCTLKESESRTWESA